MKPLSMTSPWIVAERGPSRRKDAWSGRGARRILPGPAALEEATTELVLESYVGSSLALMTTSGGWREVSLETRALDSVASAASAGHRARSLLKREQHRAGHLPRGNGGPHLMDSVDECCVEAGLQRRDVDTQTILQAVEGAQGHQS